MRLVDIAPRLGLARDQILAERAAARAHRARVISATLRLDALVAHRELQLIRAEATGDGRYIARRHHKLARAREARARLERAA